MMARPIGLLVAAILLATATSGCIEELADLGEDDEQGAFALVTVEGTITEHGEDRHPHACGRPAWTAGLNTGEEPQLSLREDPDHQGPIRLALWDTIQEVHAGGWSACEWPRLTTTASQSLGWRLNHNYAELALTIQVVDGNLSVGNHTLLAGQSWTTSIDQQHDTSEENGSPQAQDSYTYNGSLTFTYHGLWPDDRLTFVDSEEEIRGVRGTWRVDATS